MRKVKTTKPHHRIPHRVMNLQMFNVLTYWPRNKIYHIIESIHVIISVEKSKEKTKWEIHRKPFKTLIY